MGKEYCKGCGLLINAIPFVGDTCYRFEDGVYCEKCAKIKVEKSRKKL